MKALDGMVTKGFLIYAQGRPHAKMRGKIA